MALSRAFVLDFTIRAAGVPISGVSLGAAPPGTVVVSFLPEATTEQQATAQQIVDTFDYRARQDLTPGVIASQIASLTVAQELALRRRRFARHLLQDQAAAYEDIAALGLPLSIDEVVP
jgi:hypothetical protein